MPLILNKHLGVEGRFTVDTFTKDLSYLTVNSLSPMGAFSFQALKRGLWDRGLMREEA